MILHMSSHTSGRRPPSLAPLAIHFNPGKKPRKRKRAQIEVSLHEGFMQVIVPYEAKDDDKYYDNDTIYSQIMPGSVWDVPAELITNAAQEPEENTAELLKPFKTACRELVAMVDAHR